MATKRIVQPVTAKHDELKELMSHRQQATAEQIAEEFKDSGKQFGETVLIDARTGTETVITPATGKNT